MHPKSSRRTFLHRAASATGGALLLRPYGKQLMAATNKLNIAVIGVAGRGGENLNEVAHENIVALCDVNAQHLARALQRHPSARAYYDFRRLLESKDIDAVVIGTPDHTHAVCAVSSLETGRHVYCEKPLARTVSEVRRMTESARARKRVTQMGTQIHAGANYRRVVELVQSGALGGVREVHVWVNAVYGGQNYPTTFPRRRCIITTTSGSDRFIRIPTTRNGCPSSGGTGGHSAVDPWLISDATSWTFPTGRCNSAMWKAWKF